MAAELSARLAELRRRFPFAPGEAGQVVALMPETVAVEALLVRLAAGDPRRRDDLRGRGNLAGGSGGHLGRFVEIVPQEGRDGAEFLKTSVEHRSATAAEGLDRELPAERRRLGLGIYHPRRLWFLSHGDDGAFWACSVTPRLEILRQRFNDADPRAWELYLAGFRMAFELARHESLMLDCNPNNFGLEQGGLGERLYYVDDDLIGEGQAATFGVQALLRLREYPRADPEHRLGFLRGFLDLTDEYSRRELLRWGLLDDLDTDLLWPAEPELRALLSRLAERLRSTRRRRRR